MKSIETVTLELLRPGPIHNQLLSPLTPYLAICGQRGVVTLTLPFEHQELLWRLATLRYHEQDGSAQWEPIPAPRRKAEEEQIGRDLAGVLADIPPLLAEITEARRVARGGVHLRLILWGSELSLIPFEFSFSPKGFANERQPLLLQSGLPISLTREVRGASDRPLRWSRQPRVLYCYASPPGFQPIPRYQHYLALRKAMDTWLTYEIPSANEPGDPNDEAIHLMPKVNGAIEMLPFASIEDIRAACHDTEYTHVHILAHGMRDDGGGVIRHGLALHKHTRRDQYEVVSGKRLAYALCAGSNRPNEAPPQMVTLMVCDSGNPGSVLAQGGSIAHEIQDAGIPWVVASQLPLTTGGSITLVDQLYDGLLRGLDPRRVICEARRTLSIRSGDNHDWASVVVYASIPADFDEQVFAFRQRYLKQQRDAHFQRAFLLLDAARDRKLEISPELREEVLKQVSLGSAAMEEWRTILPDESERANRAYWAEYFGMLASTSKRQAEVSHRLGEEQDGVRELLTKACREYERAMEYERDNHWVTTQFLALKAILGRDIPQQDWYFAFRSAEFDLRHATDDVERAWAHGTLAELIMLGLQMKPPPTAFTTKGQVTAEVRRHCRAIVELVGPSSEPVRSTRKQFRRYVSWWTHQPNGSEAEWVSVAQEALEALG